CLREHDPAPRCSLLFPCRDVKLLNRNEIWRRRVEVESTIRPAKGRIADFEGREGHRTPFAPAFRIALPPRTHLRGQIRLAIFTPLAVAMRRTFLDKRESQTRVTSNPSACVLFNAAA